ncbi:MAG TPA: DUF2249 domain-containing protein [Propionibacteriaceae bacterium]|nr:DUF2249 domain-containing protein [Propionibacteriaceae bacterium]
MEITEVSHGGCACGHDSAEDIVLDVRTIPHAIRHAAVFGAFDAIPTNGSIVIVAPHLPRPLLAQLAERAPIEVEYLTEGPDAWHVRITRLAAATA